MKKYAYIAGACLLVSQILTQTYAEDRGPYWNKGAGGCFRQLNLTTEQQSQFNQLRTEHQQMRNEIRQSTSDTYQRYRADIQALLDQPVFDAQQANVLIETHMNAMKSKMISRLQNQHQMRQLLTTEQRARLDECQLNKMNKKGKHHEGFGNESFLMP